MPAHFDLEDLEGLDAVVDEDTRKTFAPNRRQKIRSFTVACLIINRTIGSGIFVTPSQILLATNSVGVSLLFWTIGGLISLCALLVWLEFGLSIPRHNVTEGEVQAVPRSGGEKNYLEHALRRPKFLATCMYGIVFILLANLSGNAIAFGEYVLLAAGYYDEHGNLTASHGAVVGVAVAALTAAILVHMASRRGGLLLNDAFAVFKLLIFLVIIILGIAVRAGANFYRAPNPPPKPGNINFETSTSFSDLPKNISGFTTSFLYILYAYSGYEQPFYVLSEVHRPRRNFAKATISTMVVVVCLFVIINVAYLCVVPLEVIKANPNVDIATLFFHGVFGTDVAKRVMQGAIALSILGNIVVMTYTAPRVKQEIAKEGILPFSLTFATGKATPLAWLKARLFRRRASTPQADDGDAAAADGQNPGALEQAPVAALWLHWCSSLLLIAVTARLSSSTAYSFLVELYSYVIVAFIGFWTATALLYLKFVRRDWVPSFRPLGGPAAAIVYWIATLFFLVTAFLKPAPALAQSYPFYLVPLIGISTFFWGIIWWLGLKTFEHWYGRKLQVTRKPIIVQDEEDGEYVVKYEVIRHRMRASVTVGDSDDEEDMETTQERFK